MYIPPFLGDVGRKSGLGVWILTLKVPFLALKSAHLSGREFEEAFHNTPWPQMVIYITRNLEALSALIVH